MQKSLVGQAFFDVMPIEKDSLLLTAETAFLSAAQKVVYVYICFYTTASRLA